MDLRRRRSVFVFAFYVIHLVAGTLLILRMARRAFPDCPRVRRSRRAGVRLREPDPFIIATPGGYQAAIIGGQAFLLAGLVCAVDAAWAATTGPAPRRLMLAAGCLWGLGIATRVTIALPLPIIILLTAFLIGRSDRAGSLWLQRLRAAIWLGAPVAVFVGALLIYNRARFDSFFEFGTGYQMTYLSFRSSLINLLPNLYSYFFRPMVMSCRFPFLTAPFGLGAQAYPKGFPIPSDYLIDEPVAGLALSTPWIWFVPVAGVFAVRAVASALRSRPAAGALEPRAQTSLLFVVSLAVIPAVTPLPFIAIYTTTIRYLVEFCSGLLLVATWGPGRCTWPCATGPGRAEPSPPRSSAWASRRSSSASLGVTGYNDMFKQHNPQLFERMVRAFSMSGRATSHAGSAWRSAPE